MRHRIPILIAAALGAAVAVRADQNAAGPHHPMGMPLRGLEKCLASADISSEARANAQAALTAGRDVLHTDGAAMKAAHEKMQTDIANGADKSVIGQDAIDADAARTKLHTDAQTVHDQVLGALSPDEQSAVSACMASNADHWKRGHGGAPPSSAPNP
jgi:hypothetical protein